MQKYETTKLWDTITSDLWSLNWSPRATSQLTFLARSWCHATSSSSDASSTRTLLLLFLNILSAVYQKRSISKPMRCKWRLFVRRSRLNQNNNPTVNAPYLTRTLVTFLRPLSPPDDRLRPRLGSVRSVGLQHLDSRSSHYGSDCRWSSSCHGNGGGAVPPSDPPTGTGGLMNSQMMSPEF